MAERQPYRGVVVPMVSPFRPDGSIDAPAVGRVVEMLVGVGTAGIFPLGTTGESASIPANERRRLVEAAVAAVRGRAMVYAGISGNCFAESVEAAHEYKQLGAQAVVAHIPSYYPLNDAEIEAYLLRLADRVPLPLVLYNIPATTHHSIPVHVVDRLRSHGNIAAIKDSANDVKRLGELLSMTGGRGGFPVLLGCSALFARGLKLGAVGIVPSGSHLAAAEYQQMFDAAMADRWDEVERFQAATDEVTATYTRGRSLPQSLARLKALLEARGLCGRTVLSPLVTQED